MIGANRNGRRLHEPPGDRLPVVVQSTVAVKVQHDEDTSLSVANHWRFSIKPKCQDWYVLGQVEWESLNRQCFTPDGFTSQSMSWGTLNFTPGHLAPLVDRVSERGFLFGGAVGKTIATLQVLQIEDWSQIIR